MYLNLNRAAWRRIAGNGALPFSFVVAGQRHIAAPNFSLLERWQQAAVGPEALVRYDPLMILGY